MLASLSGYQYTRKAWKREVFDLLLDPSFFQMDEVCIGYWRIVIDNLMTHDRTTFRDLLGMERDRWHEVYCAEPSSEISGSSSVGVCVRACM